MKVDLNDVIEAIEFEGDLLSHYYNKNTGIIIYLEDESTASYKAEDIENIDSFEDWEQELIRSLADLKNNPDDYIQLPHNEEVDEYERICQFAEDNKVEIKGSVKELKEEVENKGLINEWYDYRENYEYELAKSWCERNNIEYIC